MRIFTKNDKGAAAIEFAIVLPVLLILIFGIIEFSVMLYNKAMITNASREGARAGIVYHWPDRITESEIEAVVINYLGNNLINFQGGASATVTVAGAQGVSGNPLTVDVEYTYNYLVLSAFATNLGVGLDLSARTIMRME